MNREAIQTVATNMLAALRTDLPLVKGQMFTPAIFMFEEQEGEYRTIATMPLDPEKFPKEAVPLVQDIALRTRAADATLFVSEAWWTEGATEDEAVAKRDAGERREVVMLQFATREGLATIAHPIVRDAAGDLVALGEAELRFPEGGHGRMLPTVATEGGAA